MKKGSGFEKFFKGREKTGAAKKENIRQEKRDIRKEREEKIANAKREKRAKYRAASNNEPPKYNLEPPGSKFQKKQKQERANPSYRQQNRPFRKEDTTSRYNNKSDGGSNNKKNAITPKKANNRSTKPEKWDGPGPDKSTERKTSAALSLRPGTKTHSYSKEHPKQFPKDTNKSNTSSNTKSKSAEERRPFKPNDPRSYKREDAKPYRAEASRPVVKKKELPKKIGHQDKAGSQLRDQHSARVPINRQHTEDELMPLNKYIAHSGVCSRRDAVDLIKAGKVKVNGELILEPGHKVAVSDDVKVSGKKLNPVKDFIYILLNKPKDYITTTDDPQERKTVLDLLKGAPQVRIYPVGRLDRNTSGVLLLTNDGELSQKLTHPSNEIKKVYAVTLDKPLTKNHFEAILKGVNLEDGMATVDSLAFTDAKDQTQIGVEIHSGRNRIVRRIFEHFGYDVKALDRVMFAGLTKKNVDRSKWRYLTEKEVRDLKFFRKGRS